MNTDSREFYDYTLDVISENKYLLIDSSSDLYAEQGRDEVKSIQTYYEEKFLKQDKKIAYIKFRI